MPTNWSKAKERLDAKITKYNFKNKPYFMCTHALPTCIAGTCLVPTEAESCIRSTETGITIMNHAWGGC